MYMEKTIKKIEYVVPECNVYEYEMENAILVGSDVPSISVTNPTDGGESENIFGSGTSRGW